MTPMLPRPLALARRRGYAYFEAPYSANLIALRGKGDPGEWDGLLTLSYRTDRSGGWTTHSWVCATRPGWTYLRTPINPAGTATIAPGQYRGSHRRGLHRGRPALVQVGTVNVLRDADTDGLYEPLEPDTGTLLNIHDIRSPDALAGCIGLATPHMVELLDIWDSLVLHQGPIASLTLIGHP